MGRSREVTEVTETSEVVDEVSARLNEMLREVKHLHSAVVDRVGRRIELPASAVLHVLEECGEARLSTLAEVLRLDLSSISRQVAALEREGWLVRQRDPLDQRASLLRLSPSGGELLGRLRAARGAALADVFDDWSPAELAAFAAALGRFTAGLADRNRAADVPTRTPTRTPTRPETRSA